MAYAVVTSGTLGTPEYAVKFFTQDGNAISPWHDIPLSAGPGLFNMVVEIPRHTTAKMEIFTQLPKNPIKQDVLKQGQVRHLDCAFYWNYGAIPQTWESPNRFVHEYGNGNKLELVGDNDPLDVVDIGDVTLETGAVVPFKVVGALALVDQGEIDFKIFGIRTNDKHFDDVNDLDDIDVYYPGTTSGITEFFRWYKTPRGKPLNKFLPEKQFLTKQEALDVIERNHKDYLELLQGKHDPRGLSLV